LIERVEPEKLSGPEMVAVLTADVPFPTKRPVSVVEPVPPRATCRVPMVSDSAMPKVEVETQLGRPVAKEVCKMVPPVEEASVARFALPPPIPPKTREPSATAESPVPPPPTPRLPVMVGVLKVKVPPEFVMVWEMVRPWKVVAEEVAKVMAPVCAEPPPFCVRERRPVFVMDGATLPTTVKAEQEIPEEQDAEEVATEESAAVPLPKRSWPALKVLWPVPPLATVRSFVRFSVFRAAVPVLVKFPTIVEEA
jgi:hypothetical protein